MKRKVFFNDLRVVDVLGLLVFLGIMMMAYLFLLRRGEYVDVVLRVSQSDLINTNTGGVSATLPAWYLENFKEDDVKLNKSSILIVKVFEYQNNSNEKIVYLTLRMQAKFDKNSQTYSYEGIPLLVGSYQNFRYEGVMLRGIIQKVGGLDQKREEKTLMVEGKMEVEEYLANKLVKGLSISDSNDRVIAKIEAVETFPAGGDKKVIKLKLKIVVEKFDDIFLYGGEETIKIGEELNLDFWNFNARVLVTGFEEVVDNKE
ncbi:TPA: hypothetical protein DD455_03420 [Candidatus Shapirobacteria bacterium]|nr:MAG: hypothetical protein US46_C0009G0011 [Candidatus Shapirobacteria bacterium GW2011_GWF2_37_20]HBP51352.1 hypothetical protein [Candidatus Shapirobacteria bacterium]